MSGTRATHVLIRLPLVLAGGAVTLSWLWALFLFPEGWQDHHGYNQYFAALWTSALHWAVCLPLAFAYQAGVLRPWLPLLFFMSPIAHEAGRSIEWPGRLLFFVAPSVAILVVGVLEVRYARSSAGSCGSGPRAASDVKPVPEPERQGT
jgi:hypothetical protein